MAELALSGVSLAFGGLQVLQDVSFEARAGELLALIGPNGAGKTSVLNCVSGLYRPQRGRIALEMADHAYVMENGRVVLDGPPQRLREHQDIREFYLGTGEARRRSYRDVKQYRRSRRWYG